MKRTTAVLAALAFVAPLTLAGPADAATHSACSITGGNIKECARVHFAARDGRGIKATGWRVAPGKNGSNCGMFAAPMVHPIGLVFYNGNGHRIRTLYYKKAYCNAGHSISVKTTTNKLTVRIIEYVDYTSFMEPSRWVHHRIVGHR